MAAMVRAKASTSLMTTHASLVAARGGVPAVAGEERRGSGEESWAAVPREDGEPGHCVGDGGFIVLRGVLRADAQL